jgi:RTX calcium-binding nonapeptide repeat (4 copies)
MLANRRSAFVLILAGALLAVAAVAVAKTSHAGWPHVPVKRVKFAKPGGSTFHGTHLSDELLGGNGSDTLYGEGDSDVLWGDQHPGPQSPHQHDRIFGGDGKDFIYTSHGFNTIDAGDGDDRIHAHFGQGSIDCGPGTDTVFVSHKSEKHYKITGCETISHNPTGV